MSATMDVKKIYGQTLEQLMAQNRDIMVGDADLMYLAGSWDLCEKYPQQYFQVGIAEQNLLGVAAGAATMGKTVFVFAFANFLALRAADQASNTICYNELDVKICGGYAGLSSGINGGTHISVNDVAVFRSLPSMVVIDPGDGIELEQALRLAAANPGPVYIRISKGPMPTVFDAGRKLEWGKGIALQSGGDITLITTGITTWEGVNACAQLRQAGIIINHIHLPFIKPVDREIVVKAAQKSRWIVTAENHSVIGGLGSAASETLAAEDHQAKLLHLGITDCFAEGIELKTLLKQYGISADELAERIRGL